MISDLVFVAQIAIKSSVAVLLASVGEILAERSGVLNLGVEGMMLVGALAAAVTGILTGNPVLAICGGIGAGGIMALIHAVFAVTLRSNQVLSGLALTILGMGLTSFLGRPFIGKAAVRLKVLPVPGLSEIPIIGPVLFKQPAMAYAAYMVVPLTWYLLFRTRLGLKIRATGEDAASVDTAGISVARIRYGCTLAGGMLAGLAGSYLSLSYTPGWKDSMTSGQGWVAIAMVIFATWNPLRAVLGALLFGGLTALQFYFQAVGVELIPSWLLRMLPYLLTIVVLVLVTAWKKARFRVGAPADLGVPFVRGD
ncbi:MAG: ABC transporter permease [Desulfohalobiaceae bacterium]